MAKRKNTRTPRKKTGFRLNWRKQSHQLFLLIVVSLIPIVALVWSIRAIYREFDLGPIVYYPDFRLGESRLVGLATPPTSDRPVSVYFQVRNGSPSIELGFPTVSLNPLTTILLAVPTEEEQFCIRNVYIMTSEVNDNQTPWQVAPDVAPAYSFGTPECNEVDTETARVPTIGAATKIQYQHIPIPPEQVIPDMLFSQLDHERFFPFDQRVTEPVFIWLGAQKVSGEEIMIAPQMSMDIDLPGWDETVIVQYSDILMNGQSYPATSVSFALQRDLSVRVITVTLLAALTFFITLLLFVQEAGTAMEVGVGILLGLWGVQGVAVPDTITVTTLFDYGIQILYIYLAAVFFLRFITIPLYRRLTN